MGTWGEVEQELLNLLLPNGAPDFDKVRRRHLRSLAEYTGHSVIVYETAGFAPPPGTSPDDVSISLDPDIGAFMEVVHGLPTSVPLDLILHSPGGTAEAAEAIVDYLRGRFPTLRVVVPVAAMSAATMVAMAADEIVMGTHSQLGPIDPQITIATPEGPAQHLLLRFGPSSTRHAETSLTTPSTPRLGCRFCAAWHQHCYRYARMPRNLRNRWSRNG